MRQEADSPNPPHPQMYDYNALLKCSTSNAMVPNSKYQMSANQFLHPNNRSTTTTRCMKIILKDMRQSTS